MREIFYIAHHACHIEPVSIAFRLIVESDAFADGAFARLDDFTNMIWPYDVEEFNKSTQGEFQGIGIQIDIDEQGGLKVVSPIEDTPAYRAGIKAGDVITHINGKNAKGITINGLPILLKRPGYLDLQDLEQYYKDCVVGGRGAFVIPIRERNEFADATRTKLLLEIAGLEPPQEPRIHRAQVEKPRRADCEVGEKMWRERWERGN